MACLIILLFSIEISPLNPQFPHHIRPRHPATRKKEEQKEKTRKPRWKFKEKVKKSRKQAR